MNPRTRRQRRKEKHKTAAKARVPTLPLDPGELALAARGDALWAQWMAEDEARRAERARYLTAVGGWPSGR